MPPPHQGNTHPAASLTHPPCPPSNANGTTTTPNTNSGAAQGEGLGNAFLSHIAAVDGIFHVTRAFDDPDVIHVRRLHDDLGDLVIL